MDKDIRMLDYADGFAIHKDTQSILVRDTDPSLVPAVSIMIPTYQRPALLKEAVASALAQTTTVSFEVVVVDNDADPAEAAEVDRVIASFNAPNLRLYRNQANIGMFGNWNRCIELARGEWLCILNDDDLLKPRFIDAACQARVGQAMVACNVEHFGALAKPAIFEVIFKPVYRSLRNAIRYRNGVRHVVLSDILCGNPVSASLGVLFHRSTLIRLGGYNEALAPTADYALNVRYWLQEEIIVLAEKLASYRLQTNESLKVGTLRGFLVNDWQLRNELIAALPATRPRKCVLNYLSRLQTKMNAFAYQRRMNAAFPATKLLRELGLSALWIYNTPYISGLLALLWALLASSHYKPDLQIKRL